MKLRELRNLLVNASNSFVSEEEAEYFADEVVETAVRKPPFDKGIVSDVESWKEKPGEIRKSIDLPGYTQYDLGGKGPSLKIKAIHDELYRKAESNGIAMVSIINSGGMHILHLWSQGLAKRGLFAIGAWNGGPDAVVPLDGTKGIMGTNPLTYGFPGDKGDVVVDMATSEIPYYKIVAAQKEKQSLPPNTAVDQTGEVTIDADKAFDENGISNLLPMGGNYKGYNINYLFEVMTSAMLGTKISADMHNDYIEAEHGGFIIAVSPEKVGGHLYQTSIRSMNEEIRAQKPKAGVDRVMVPGDINLEKKAGMSGETEVDISEESVTALIKLATKNNQ